MKKSFLIFGALGAILATNGYAVQSGGVVITYTCPEGCTLQKSEFPGYTYATCKHEDGTDCGNPTRTETEIKATGVNVVTPTKKVAPVSARAARIGPKSRQDFSDITPLESNVEEKVASGTSVIECPAGCTLRYKLVDNSSAITWCVDADGNKCQEQVTTTSTTNSLR